MIMGLQYEPNAQVLNLMPLYYFAFMEISFPVLCFNIII